MNGWKVQGAAGLVAFALMGCMAVPFAFAGDDGRILIYRGGEEEYVVAGSTVFSQEESNLPGDALEGALYIENDSEVSCEVFTMAEDVVVDGPDDLASRIGYAVRKNESEQIYGGTLADAGRGEPVSLGVLAPGQTMAAGYGMSIPADLTNEYADASVDMNMAVSIIEHEEDGTGLVQTGGGSNGGTGAGLVHAGDAPHALPFVLGALAAAGAVIWCAWKRRMRMW